MAAAHDVMMYQVTVPRGLKPGDAFTLGLPSGAVRTLIVPSGVHGGMTYEIAIQPSALEKVAESAGAVGKSIGARLGLAAAAVKHKAREEQWERKAQAATRSVMGAGANFVSGFKQGLAAEPRPAPARQTGDGEEPRPYPAAPPALGDAGGNLSDRMVVCIVPEGLAPGAQMIVATPEGPMQTTVPPGARPGSEIHVRYR